MSKLKTHRPVLECPEWCILDAEDHERIDTRDNTREHKSLAGYMGGAFMSIEQTDYRVRGGQVHRHPSIVISMLDGEQPTSNLEIAALLFQVAKGLLDRAGNERDLLAESVERRAEKLTEQGA